MVLFSSTLFRIGDDVAVIGHVNYSENAEDALSPNVEHIVRSEAAEMFGVKPLKSSERNS